MMMMIKLMMNQMLMLMMIDDLHSDADDGCDLEKKHNDCTALVAHSLKHKDGDRDDVYDIEKEGGIFEENSTL